MTTVVVEFYKWPERRHYHMPLRSLGEDVHGHWLGCAAGAIFLRPDGVEASHQVDLVLLVPRNDSWVAEWFRGHADLECYVHVTGRPCWDGNRVMALDLDLDVVRYHDGRVEVLDEDELELHRRLYGYSAEMVADATSQAARLRGLLAARVEPFGDSALTWLERIT
jgi:uncharacterized protein